MTAPYTPGFVIPSAIGQLSNLRGGNLTTDKLLIKFTYANPRGSGDACGTVRAVATRIQANGQTTNQLGWDGTAGVPTTNPALSFPTTMRSLAVRWKGRVYLIDLLGTVNTPPPWFLTGASYYVQSAPISGGTVGSPRSETGIYDKAGGGTHVTGACVVSDGTTDRLYVLTSGGNVYYTALNPDGSLAQWHKGAVAFPIQAGRLIGGYSLNGAGTMQGWIATIGGAPAAASSNVQICGLNINYGANDGSLAGWTTTGMTQLPVNRGRHAVWFDPDGAYVVVAGGDDNTSAVGTVYTAPVTGFGLIGTWTASTNALPLARSAAAVVVTSGFIFVLGGSSTTADTGGTSTVYETAITSAGAITGTWNTRTALPVNLSLHSAFLTDTFGSLGTPYVVVTAGRTAVPADMLTTYENQDQGDGTLGGSWNSGVSSLSAGQLGTGGVVTNNQDGTQTITFLYGAFGATPVIGVFTDGDQVQLVLTVTDAQGGDIAPAATTVILIGQPPTISSITWSDTSGKPTLSFGFTGGAGASPEQWWRIIVKDAGLNVFFDSGIRYDLANSAVIDTKLLNNQLLASGTVYTATISVASFDNPISGSSASASTTSNDTPAGTAPSVPTALTVTPDNTNGLVTVAATAPAAGSVPTAARVWRRVTGTTPWILLKDNVACAGLSQPISVQLMDDIKFGVGYDYAVSVISATPLESTRTAAAAGTIAPILPTFSGSGYTAMLHVAGNGPSQHAGLKLGANAVAVTEVTEMALTLLFGASAPVPRFGTGFYRQVRLHHVMRDSAAGLDAIVAAARAGSILCLRDKTGLLLYCVPVARARTDEVWGAGGGLYFEEDLDLVEVAYTYAP